VVTEKAWRLALAHGHTPLPGWHPVPPAEIPEIGPGPRLMRLD